MSSRPHSFKPWPNGIRDTLYAVGIACNDATIHDLPATLDLIAGIFGFPTASANDWREFREWCLLNNVDFTLARGPHVMTILKAMAAKRGRTNVSTPSSE